MSEAPAPRVSRRLSLPLIWIVPLIALAIAGWMLARQFRNRGPLITIEFQNGAGIEASKTVLEHKGVAVGMVESVALKPDLSGVIVHLRLTKTAANLARAGSEFWVVHPEVSLTGVRGLETILSGVFMNVRPGHGPPANQFRGLDQPPAIEDTAAGRAFFLRTEHLGSVGPGSPVYFRGLKVGGVETTRLTDDSTAALVRIRIYNPYVALVRTNTVFWNAGGIAFKLSLLGAELKATSIESLFEGGISFATPDRDGLAPPAQDGAEFELHPAQEREWAKWQPRIPIQPLESPPEPSKEDGAPAAAALTK